jgi:hypothetical protein
MVRLAEKDYPDSENNVDPETHLGSTDEHFSSGTTLEISEARLTMQNH